MGGARWLARTSLLAALLVVIQGLALPQMITGSAVNAVLFLASVLSGLAGGLIIGAFSPLIAVLRGTVPAALAPAIPLIALGNITLVAVFVFLYKRGPVAGVVTASLLKFLVLSLGVRFVIQLQRPVALMLSTPQLLTALLGGAVALISARILARFELIRD